MPVGGVFIKDDTPKIDLRCSKCQIPVHRPVMLTEHLQATVRMLHYTSPRPVPSVPFQIQFADPL
jgi:hypothetical protein